MDQFVRNRFLIGIFVLAMLIAGGATCVAGMVSMPGKAFVAESRSDDGANNKYAAQLKTDVEKLATTIGERNVTKAPEALTAAREFIREELVRAGYSVSDEAYVVNPSFRSKDVTPKSDVQVRNLIAERRGRTKPDETIVVGAHYDSAEGTPGADDNASGVAVGLALARAFSAKEVARTVRFVFFVNEEPPWFRSDFMGSDVHAKASRGRNDNIVAMLSLETMGYFSDAEKSQHYPWPLSLVYPDRGNFIAFVGNVESRALVRHCVKKFREEAGIASDGAAVPARIQGVDWSDHGPFWRQGYPALMVTDTAIFRNPHYHRATDQAETVNFVQLARVTDGLVKLVDDLSTRDLMP